MPLYSSLLANQFTPTHLFPFLLRETTLSKTVYCICHELMCRVQGCVRFILEYTEFIYLEVLRGRPQVGGGRHRLHL